MRHNFFAFSLPCLAFLFILAAGGCVLQRDAASREIKACRSGSLAMEANDDAPRTIYVDIQNCASAILSQNLEKTLLKAGFSMADSPSSAGHILHVSILQQGAVDPAVLQNLVNAGYGAEARFSGRGAYGLLADALMVQRRVPSAKRPSRARLKNISTRNALGSSQMRLGLFAFKSGPAKGELNPAFAEALALELQSALAKDGSGAAAR